MKRILFALFALVLFSVNMNAQKVKQFSWNKKNMTEVGLSPEQQSRVDSIKTASNQEIEAVKSDSALSEDTKKNKLQELHKKRLVNIDALLTVEQKKKVEEIKARIKKENETSQ